MHSVLQVRDRKLFKMSQMQLLRAFISERLRAAAEEIFSAVQRTISEEEDGFKQEEPACGDDTLQVFVCAHEQKPFRQEWSPESCHNNTTVGQEDGGLLLPEPPAIKQEQPWSSPEEQQLPDLEEYDTNTWSGNEGRKPVPETSVDHRTDEGNAQSSRGCWTLLPDCSVTLNNVGPELDLATLTSEVHTQSPTQRNQLTKGCEKRRTTPPNTKTKRRNISYHCRFCGKEFSHNTHLAAHTQIHIGEKLFVCEVCGKEFRHSSSVAAHRRIHTEEKPYCCTVCGKEFRHVGNLNVHMRMHTGEKPYTCTVCGKKFSRNNLMTKHMAVHTGEMSLSMKSALRRGSVGMTS